MRKAGGFLSSREAVQRAGGTDLSIEGAYTLATRCHQTVVFLLPEVMYVRSMHNNLSMQVLCDIFLRGARQGILTLALFSYFISVQNNLPAGGTWSVVLVSVEDTIKRRRACWHAQVYDWG